MMACCDECRDYCVQMFCFVYFFGIFLIGCIDVIPSHACHQVFCYGQCMVLVTFISIRL
jgi:hypothetical protein